MCGIVGLISAYSNGLTNNEADAFGDMLFVDTLRGWDSTGIFGVSKHGNVQILKEASSGPDFLQTKDYKEFRSAAIREGKIIVGHNRAATRGTINDRNAHPFHVDDRIVLVQNGTYFGDHKHHKDVEVDTEAVAHVIAEHESVEEALQKVNAAYALAWYNVQKQTLNLIRNHQRPLWLGETKSGAFLFASELPTILWAAGRNNLSLKDFPVELTPFTLVEFYANKQQSVVRKDIALNASFQNKHSPYMGNALASEFDGYHQAHRPQRHEFTPVMALPAPKATPKSGEGRSKNVHDYIHANKFSEFAIEASEVDDVMALAHKLRNNDHAVVEFLDYLPAAKDYWVLYGSLIQPGEADPAPLLFTYFSGTELEVMSFIAKSLYTVRAPGQPINHLVQGIPTNYHVVSLFVSEPIPIAISNLKDSHEHVPH